DALHWGGSLLTDTGRADEARKVHDRALDLYAKLPATTPPLPERAKMTQRYINMAQLLGERKRMTEAGNAYRKATELHPKFAAAPFNLGAALASRNKLDEAADLYSRWLEVYPDEHSNWYQAAGLYLSIGDVGRYRGACREMLDRFERLATEKPEIAERTDRACGLAPDS